jgi:thymidylate kinase
MFLHVEGMNCSGKSTYIQKLSDTRLNFIGERPIKIRVLDTPWINPHRWNDDFKCCVNQDDYILGAYESIFHLYKDYDDLVIFDRSFISSFVYGSISEFVFCYLAKLYGGSKLYYMDTKVETCKKRWEERKRDYAPNFDWDILNHKFLSTIEKLRFEFKWEYTPNYLGE